MFRSLHERIGELSHKLDLIERVLMVREPGSVKAADAYEGLRRQAHLAHLAQLDAAVRRGATTEALRGLLRDLMQQAGLQTIDDPAQRDAFEVVEGKGDQLEVLEPAHVDGGTGRLVRQGRARATAAAVASPSASVLDGEKDTETVDQ
jgi:hypothetical protein